MASSAPRLCPGNEKRKKDTQEGYHVMAMFCYLEQKRGGFVSPLERVELAAEDLRGASFVLHCMSCEASAGTVIDDDALALLRGCTELIAESLELAAEGMRGGDAA